MTAACNAACNACRKSVILEHNFVIDYSGGRGNSQLHPLFSISFTPRLRFLVSRLSNTLTMPFSEETPLLHDNGTHEYGRIKNHDLIYERFSPRQKRALVAIVSWCGLMPCTCFHVHNPPLNNRSLPVFVSATIYPSIPQMVSDFNSTPQIIGSEISSICVEYDFDCHYRLTVSISILAMSIGALIAASYSTFCKWIHYLNTYFLFLPFGDGRRPIYLCALPLLIIGSIGVSVSRSVWELFFYRVFQAAGASPGFSIGAGVIGDIYKLEERGTAIGIFLAVSYLLVYLILFR